MESPSRQLASAHILRAAVIAPKPRASFEAWLDARVN